ncbi:MAG: hypothetical protein ACYDGL_05085 [Bellilinea sp.]
MPKQNRGQQYEVHIRELLRNCNLLPANLHNNDAGFIHRGKEYYLEVKNFTAPDYGQKGLIWKEDSGWGWRDPDNVTELYDQFGVKDFIDPNFIPKKHSKPQSEITVSDKRFDQINFKKSNIDFGNPEKLYEYYARKHCYYIQIEEKGFYYLKEDIANLGVPQFMPQLRLRLRAKTHNSIPIHNYSFFAVIQINKKSVCQSIYDIDEKVGKFPPISV